MAPGMHTAVFPMPLLIRRHSAGSFTLQVRWFAKIPARAPVGIARSSVQIGTVLIMLDLRNKISQLAFL